MKVSELQFPQWYNHLRFIYQETTRMQISKQKPLHKSFDTIKSPERYTKSKNDFSFTCNAFILTFLFSQPFLAINK